MKRSLFFGALTIVAGLVIFMSSHPSDEVLDVQVDLPVSEGASTTHSEAVSGHQEDLITRVVGGVTKKGDLVQGNHGGVADPSQVDEKVEDDGFINKVLSAQWIDPKGKAGRRRVRVVEAEFKYPNIRLEEEVWTDPKTGKKTVKRIRASVADHLLVGLKKEVDIHAASKILKNNGYDIRSVGLGSYILVALADFSSATSQEKSIHEIESLVEFVNFAEPDYLVYPSVFPNDPGFMNWSLWGLGNPRDRSANIPEAHKFVNINAPDAWDIRTDASNVVVAVTDTGVNYLHEDLAANMWSDPLTGDYGYDALDDDSDPMDVDGHGSHCAGTIGAKGNNGIGVTGVAWDVQIMAGRFIGDNGGTVSDAIKVIDYARQHGAHIISASWGGGGFSQALYGAIEDCSKAGIIFVAAAGNNHTNNDFSPHYPSSYDLPNLVSVAASSIWDTLSGFSNSGHYSVDLAAPGSGIYSTYLGMDAYRTLDGTSMATPHVSGALALAKAEFPTESAEDLIARLYSSVDPLESMEGKLRTGGRLNLHRLLGESTPVLKHDEFAQALELEGSYAYWSGSNQRATREEDESAFSPGHSGVKSLWFSWTAPHDGLLELSAFSDTASLELVAYRGATKDSLQKVDADDSLDDVAKELLRFYVNQGDEYRFVVDSNDAISQNLRVHLMLRPLNDALSDAAPLSGDHFSARANSYGATEELFEKKNPHGGVGNGRSVWWMWTPEFDGEFVISTKGSYFDTVLAVYSGTPESLTYVISNDDEPNQLGTSKVSFTVTSGTTYYISVDGYYKGSAGEILLSGYMNGELLILQQPDDVAVTFGKSVSLRVVVSSSNSLNYEWHGPNGVIAGFGQSPGLSIANAQAVDMGEYWVFVSDGETTIESEHVQISQTLEPPRFDFVPANMQVLGGAGNSLELHVKLSGASPMIVQWYKDDQAISGANGVDFTISPVELSDEGWYHITASNASGGIESQKFRVNVVESSWGAWVTRFPLPSGNRIQFMKYLNGQFIAVGEKGLIMISDDGKQWETPYIGKSIDFTSVTYGNGIYVAVGYYRADSVPMSATSSDGRHWTIGTAAYYSFGEVCAGDGVFLAGPSSYSTDGLNWISRDPSFGSNSIVYAQGKFLALDNSYYKIHISTDGLNWQSVDHPFKGSFGNVQVMYLNGSFIAYDKFNNKVTTSPDGLTWSNPISSPNAPARMHQGRILVSDGSRLLYLSGNVWESPDGVQWQEHKIKNSLPNSNVSDFRFLASGDGKVALAGGIFRPAYGTDFNSIQIDPFVNNVQIIYSVQSVGSGVWGMPDFRESPYMLHTSDGVNWTQRHVKGETIYPPTSLCQSDRYYYAISSDYLSHRILRGNSPISMEKYPTVGGQDISTGLAYYNGVLLAISKQKLLQLNDQDVWEVVYETTGQYESIKSLTSHPRGFIAATSEGKILLSSDGVQWKTGTQLGLDPPAPYAIDSKYSIFETGSKLWLFKKRTRELYVAPSGFSFSKITTPYVFDEMVGLPNGLVAKAGDVGYYSADGYSWSQFTLPGGILHLESAFDTLLGWGTYTIFQMGSPQNLAPLCNFQQFGLVSSVAQNSQVPLTVKATDPENRLLRVELWRDGVLFGEDSSEPYLFNVLFDELGQHTVEARAYDQDGGVGSAVHAVFVNAAPPVPLPMLASSKNDVTQIESWDGGFIALRGGGIEISKDGNIWTTLSLPVDADPRSLVMGNGIMMVTSDVLVAAYTTVNVWVSSDGVSWRQTSHKVSGVSFQDGYFVANIYNPYPALEGGAYRYSPAFSKDGIHWLYGLSGDDRTAQEVAIGNDVFLVWDGSALLRSLNGSTWTENKSIAGIKSLLFDGVRFVALTDSQVIVSADGLVWTTEFDVPLGATEHTYQLFKESGALFLSLGEYAPRVQWVRRGQGEWEKVEAPVESPLKISYSKGVWMCMANDGIYISTTGIRWEKTLAKETVSSAWNFRLNLSMDLVGTENGKLFFDGSNRWFSGDGYEWSMIESVEEVASSEPYDMSKGLGRYFYCYGNTLMLSENGNRWSPYTVPIYTDGWDNSEIEKVLSVAYINGEFYVYVSTLDGGQVKVLITSNGVTWRTEVPVSLLPINFIKKNGPVFLTFSKPVPGGIPGCYRSLDGLEWTLCNVEAGAKLVVANGKFVILPAVHYNGAQKIMTSIDGESWEETEYGDGFVTDYAYGNGVYMGLNTGGAFLTGDLNNLSGVSGPGGYYKNIIFQDGRFIAHGPQGIHSGEKTIAVSLDGTTWVRLRDYKGDIMIMNGEIFNLLVGDLYKIEDSDLMVHAVSSPVAELGVGDKVPVSFQITNLGEKPYFQDIPLLIEARLSKDSIFGNGDDLLMRSETVFLSADLNEGQTVSVNASFSIPEIENGGAFFVGLQVRTAYGDNYGYNNTAMTTDSVVTVPEWVLNMNTNGDGQVTQSRIATRYPHKSHISLVASAGKGSAFSGWEGDALGQLSQTTILMDGNKSIQANFSSSANLQVLLRGNGRVDGINDSGSYSVGSLVQLTATPADGWEFSGWSGAAAGPNATANITMDSPKAVTAKFVLPVVQWKNKKFNAAELLDIAISGDDADPDHDGLKNWQEYLHGSDPKNAASKGVLSLKVGGGWLYVIYTRNTGPEGTHTLFCQATRDMSGWDATDLQERILRTEDGIETVEARIPVAGGDKGFLRLMYRR